MVGLGGGGFGWVGWGAAGLVSGRETRGGFARPAIRAKSARWGPGWFEDDGGEQAKADATDNAGFPVDFAYGHNGKS